MRIRNTGYAMVGTGILLAIFSLTADFLGFGEGGVQAAQILGIEAGVFLALIGLGVAAAQRNGELTAPLPGFRALAAKLSSLPAIVWVLLGFSIVFLQLFVAPSFLNADHRMHYFNRFIPDVYPIGRDLTYSTDSIGRWLVGGQNLYDAEYHVYPPLYAVIFAPLLLLHYPINYAFITAVTLLSMAALCLVIPALPGMRRDASLAIFFFLTAIVSYGMLFELERGQFNILAFGLAVAAIYLFHHRPAFRHLAYALYSLAIQLKIYPALLIFMFVRDWRDWKSNLLRLLGLGLFNLALLFSLGPAVMGDFVRVITTYTGATWSRPYNHSIRSFVYALAYPESGGPAESWLAWLRQNLALIELLLTAYFLLCLGLILVRAYRERRQGVHFDLLLASTVGAMLLPSVSIDYKLPLLAPVLSMALAQRPWPAASPKRFAAILLVTLIGVAYSVTLFSFVDRGNYPANSLPLLLLILTGITLLDLLDDPQPAAEQLAAETNL